jgi:hypothetical protein
MMTCITGFFSLSLGPVCQQSALAAAGSPVNTSFTAACAHGIKRLIVTGCIEKETDRLVPPSYLSPVGGIMERIKSLVTSVPCQTGSARFDRRENPVDLLSTTFPRGGKLSWRLILDCKEGSNRVFHPCRFKFFLAPAFFSSYPSLPSILRTANKKAGVVFCF